MPVRTPSASPATPGTRLQVLDPFIAKLQSALGEPAQEGADGETLSLRISGKELTVDSWTTQKLHPQPQTDEPLASDCCRVVTLGVALLAKCTRDLSNLEAQLTNSTGSLYSARAELMLDAAIGGSLVKDIQQIIDELLKQGLVEEAGGLSKFHHQLRHTVFDLRKQVAPEYRSTIETLADQLSESPSEDETADDAADAYSAPDPAERAAPAPPRPRPGDPCVALPRRPRPSAGPTDPEVAALLEPASRMPSRTAMLAIMLILTTLGLIGLRRAGSPLEGRDIAATLEAPSFQEVVRLVEDRWPSLYVTVESSAWKRLDEEKQLEFVREIASPLATAHYSGVFVRTADGRPLAQWLGTEGATLLDGRAED